MTMHRGLPCDVCQRLPKYTHTPGSYPPPVSADEWEVDDQIHGALLGCLIGEAAGIRRHKKDVALVDVPVMGTLPLGGASQLVLLTNEAMLRMRVRAEERGIGPAWGMLRDALERWAFIQDEPVRRPGIPELGGGKSDGWVVHEHALHGRVKGFSAVRQALRSTTDPSEAIAARQSHIPKVTRSNGAGGLVRSVSAGLLFEADHAIEAGVITAGWSHDGADGRYAAGALARIVADILRGFDLPRAIDDTVAALAEWPASDAIIRAISAPANAPPGESTAAKSLRSGVAMALGRPSVIEAVAGAAAYGGTADAMVAGAIVGALGGRSGIPAPWRLGSPAAGIAEALGDATSVAYRAFVMRRPIKGDDSESDGWDGGPGVAMLWADYPGA